MRKKSILKKLIIALFLFIFCFGYIRQMITMNRIEKEIQSKQSQLDEIKTKHERLQDEVNKIDEGSLDYLERLARENKLSAYKHDGFWQCMDTQRDKEMLEKLWKENKAKWKVWN